MAIDTRSKRASSVRARKPWQAEGPIGAGSLDAADRAHSTWSYAGILAAGAVSGYPPRRWRMGRSPAGTSGGSGGERMTVHLLALPGAPTSADFPLCGFTQATLRFARLLKRLRMDVLLYGAVGNEATEIPFIPILTETERTALLGAVPYQNATLLTTPELYRLANTRMIAALRARARPGDVLATIGGLAQAVVAQAVPECRVVEWSIGYLSAFAPARVYQSHVWRGVISGMHRLFLGRVADAVIPAFFDPAEFPAARPERFALFVGRLTANKGITLACQAAQAAGLPLQVIGHGDASLVTHGAEYRGALSSAERNAWMARATVLLAPTQYLEPFGAVAVEAQLCGTPVVARDWGGFVETVEAGRTGYRGTDLADFVEGIGRAPGLDRSYIRARAQATYSLEAAAPPYARYFDRLASLRAVEPEAEAA